MNTTHRRVNPGAEFQMDVVTPVLDYGYVKLVDYMGSDSTVCDAARVSYNKVTIGTEGNAKLINYLMKNSHTSPFEQCVLTFEVKLPIFVEREWVRHRTARMNEISGRYAALPGEFYTPTRERIKGQSKTNKQSSDPKIEVTKFDKDCFLECLTSVNKYSFAGYEAALSNGIAREVARIGLPLNLYTKKIWQCDLHNLLHFLKLRMAEDAQWEIRQYANIIAKIVQGSYPLVWAAFEEHVLGSQTVPKSLVDKWNTFLATSEAGGTNGQVRSSEGVKEGSEAATTGHFAPRNNYGGHTKGITLPVSGSKEAKEDVEGSASQDFSRAKS